MVLVHRDITRSIALPVGAILGPDFFARSSDQVARDLIGKILWSVDRGGGRLTEVEAYLPMEDPASHSARGWTKRNAAMFGPPGTIYVFLSYGVHYLLNIVCDREEIGSAVLIRAFEAAGNEGAAPRGRPMPGVRRAPGPAPVQRRSFCGPGRVGKALGVHSGLNGLSLGEESGLVVVDDGTRPEVGNATRVGISRGDMLPLRYYSLGSTCVTRRSKIRGGPCE
jgi:DNA-3-methyladenine glycosylase